MLPLTFFIILLNEVVLTALYFFRRLVHMAEILICNDLHADILVNQLRPKGGQRSNSETFQSIGCRECFGFVWPSQKAVPLCKISVRDPDWKASDTISFHKLGYRLVNISKSSHKLFVNVQKFSGCQKLVIHTTKLTTFLLNPRF